MLASGLGLVAVLVAAAVLANILPAAPWLAVAVILVGLALVIPPIAARG